MKQAIVTRYLGPTNYHGARIVARCQAKRIIVPWASELDTEANHARAALYLASRLGWIKDGFRWAEGALPGNQGYCFVEVAK